MAMDPMEALVDEINIRTKNFISHLTEEWKVMYNFDETLKKKYARNIIEIVQTLYDDVTLGELQKKESMIQDIEKCLKERSQLQKDLHITIETNSRDDDPLQTILQTLNSDLKQYRDMRDERLKQLDDLRKKEAELCELLGAEPLIITSSLPSPLDLQELDQHIFKLRKLKIDRTNLLVTARGRLNDMMSRLELSPVTAFEKEVTDCDPVSFKLTVQNMSKLDEIVLNYENLVTEGTERVHLLESKLEKLWERIRIPDEERIAFNATYFGIGSSAVSALTQEIERCEALKRANMKSVIEMVRKEIVTLWDMMTFTPEARMEFGAYFTNTYSEDVLELHELEQSRLQMYYEKYRDLFSMAEKREQLLEKMEAFAASAKDPNRYKNRGGQLLREEKERKSTEANLMKIDAQLKRMLPEYQLENNHPFLWRGENLLVSLDSGAISKTHVNRHHQVQRTPVAKENKPATKRKIGRADETFILATKLMTPSSSVDSGINMKQLSSDSLLSSYSQFQNAVDAGSSPVKRARCTPAYRTPMTTSRTPVQRTPGTKTPRRFM